MPLPKIKGNKVQIIGERSKLASKNRSDAMVIEWPRSPVHIHTYGKLSKFFKGLKEGKLYATKCKTKGCEEGLWLPPRADCPDCNQPMKWVEVKKPVGEIFAYTLVQYPGAGVEISTPYYQIDVKIPKACTIMKGYLVRGKAEIGMKVKAGFRKKGFTNTILDLYWEPLD